MPNNDSDADRKRDSYFAGDSDRYYSTWHAHGDADSHLDTNGNAPYVDAYGYLDAATDVDIGADLDAGADVDAQRRAANQHAATNVR